MSKKASTPFPKLFSDRLIVEPEEDVTTTPGGIHLAKIEKKPFKKGTVKAVGPGRSESPTVSPVMPVKVGDTVLFEAFGGCDIELDGQTYKLLRESDLVGLV